MEYEECRNCEGPPPVPSATSAAASVGLVAPTGEQGNVAEPEGGASIVGVVKEETTTDSAGPGPDEIALNANVPPLCPAGHPLEEVLARSRWTCGRCHFTFTGRRHQRYLC